VRRKSPSKSAHDAHALARWPAFSAILALVALLGIAGSAQALTVPAPDPPSSALGSVFEEDEEAEAEAEAEASEDGELEFGCSFDEEECEEEVPAAPPECLVQSAQATVLVAPNRDRVRLDVRFSTSSPTVVALDYGLHGSRGSLHLGATKKHVGRSGALHLTRNLKEAQMAKVMAAKGFTVRLRASAAPGYCDSFFDHQLDLRRATPSGLAWLQSE
jgi:hypothetical protein